MLFKKFNVFDTQMKKIVNHMTNMQIVFNVIKNTFKEIIFMIEFDWKIATFQTSKTNEIFDFFEMNSLI